MKFYEWVWCVVGCEWMTSCCITMETLKLIKIPQAHHFLPCQPAPHLASSNAQLTLNLEPLYVYTVKAGYYVRRCNQLHYNINHLTPCCCLTEVRNKYSHSLCSSLDQNIPSLFTWDLKSGKCNKARPSLACPLCWVWYRLQSQHSQAIFVNSISSQYRNDITPTLPHCSWNISQLEH